MNDEYWSAAVDNLSVLDKQLNALMEKQKDAYIKYFVSCLEIAEAKYHGYSALLVDGLTGEEEIRVENEYKDKLTTLAQERQSIIERIVDVQDQLFDFTRQDIPKEQYK